MRKWLVSLVLMVCLWGCTPKSVISPTYDFNRVNRIGIMAFSNTWNELSGVENLFAKYLIANGFKVVERAQLESVLKEHHISVSGYLSPETTREIGRILGVDALLIGEVSSYTPTRKELTMTSSHRTESRPIIQQDVMKMPDGSYVGYQRQTGTQVSHSLDMRPTEYTIYGEVGIIAKLVDVETAEIVWIGSDEESGASVLDAADLIARQLVKSFKKELAKQQKNL